MQETRGCLLRPCLLPLYLTWAPGWALWIWLMRWQHVSCLPGWLVNTASGQHSSWCEPWPPQEGTVLIVPKHTATWRVICGNALSRGWKDIITRYRSGEYSHGRAAVPLNFYFKKIYICWGKMTFYTISILFRWPAASGAVSRVCWLHALRTKWCNYGASVRTQWSYRPHSPALPGYFCQTLHLIIKYNVWSESDWVSKEEGRKQLSFLVSCHQRNLSVIPFWLIIQSNNNYYYYYPCDPILTPITAWRTDQAVRGSLDVICLLYTGAWGEHLKTNTSTSWTSEVSPFIYLILYFQKGRL